MKYIIVLTISGLIFGCGSTARFSKNESESETYQGSNKSLEIIQGVASYYADQYHGRKTANGEIYNMNDFTAAHKSYPFNTIVRVTNLSNNKSVELRINDRMPEFKGRIIDISYRAAQEIDMVVSGIIEVRLEVLKWGN